MNRIHQEFEWCQSAYESKTSSVYQPKQ